MSTTLTIHRVAQIEAHPIRLIHGSGGDFPVREVTITDTDGNKVTVEMFADHADQLVVRDYPKPQKVEHAWGDSGRCVACGVLEQGALAGLRCGILRPEITQ